jgi:hypothetical protein
MIQNIQLFVPHTATTSRLLVHHCFLTLNGNHLCRHHQAKVKQTPVIDGGNQNVGGFAVTGVPHARLLNTAQTKVTLAEGYFNCSCREDKVLMEFYFWKMWTITSPTTRMEEGWMDQAFNPRAHVFVATAYKNAMKLNINDLYTIGFTNEAHRKQVLERQVARLKKELARLEELEQQKTAARSVVKILID